MAHAEAGAEHAARPQPEQRLAHLVADVVGVVEHVQPHVTRVRTVPNSW